MAICKIPQCYNDVQCPTMGICKACYQSMLAAGKKTANERLVRLQKLEKFRARTALMSGNVVDLPKRQPVTLTVLPGQVNGPKKFRMKKKRKLHIG